VLRRFSDQDIDGMLCDVHARSSARTEPRSIDEIIRKFAALGVLREVEPGPPAVIEGTGWPR